MQTASKIPESIVYRFDQLFEEARWPPSCNMQAYSVLREARSGERAAAKAVSG
jgi:hypothetical protein